MPNWCMNNVVLKHTKDKIDFLESQLREKNGNGFFSILYPRPVEEEENWYDWNSNNWGTKWDANIDVESDMMIRLDDETLELRFDTAWGPPIDFYNFLFEDGWDVTAKYHEPGMAFIGEYDNSIDDCWEYDFSDEETLNAIPDDLREWSGIDEELEFYKESYQENEDDENETH